MAHIIITISFYCRKSRSAWKQGILIPDSQLFWGPTLGCCHHTKWKRRDPGKSIPTAANSFACRCLWRKRRERAISLHHWRLSGRKESFECCFPKFGAPPLHIPCSAGSVAMAVGQQAWDQERPPPEPLRPCEGHPVCWWFFRCWKCIWAGSKSSRCKKVRFLCLSHHHQKCIMFSGCLSVCPSVRTSCLLLISISQESLQIYIRTWNSMYHHRMMILLNFEAWIWKVKSHRGQLIELFVLRMESYRRRSRMLCRFSALL